MTYDNRFLSAVEAAHELDVTVATLYSYVSRGLVRSMASPNDSRQRRYLREDIDRVVEHKALSHNPERAAQGALQYGTPVVDSQITLIDGGRYYYRGWDAVELAASHSFEEAASIIWQFGDATLFDEPVPTLPYRAMDLLRANKRLSFIERFQIVLPMALAEDPAAYVLTPDGVVRTGARIVCLLTHVAATHADGAPSASSESGVAETIQHAWVPEALQARELLNMALVLLADHELNVSSFTARCAASAGAPPYAVVTAGIAALQGYRHGGSSERVASMLSEAVAPNDAREIVEGRLKRGETIPGFDHPLYPNGDPRAIALLDRLEASCPESQELAVVRVLVNTMDELNGLRPNMYLALASLCSILGLPVGSPLAIFAISRTVGWIAQALEQYALNTLIRPRARYTGVMPR